MKVRRIKLGSTVEFYRNDEQAVLCNEGDGGAILMVRPFRHFSLSPEIDKSQYEILIRSKKFPFDKPACIRYTCSQVQTSTCCEREEIGSSEPQRAGGW